MLKNFTSFYKFSPKIPFYPNFSFSTPLSTLSLQKIPNYNFSQTQTTTDESTVHDDASSTSLRTMDRQSKFEYFEGVYQLQQIRDLGKLERIYHKTAPTSNLAIYFLNRAVQIGEELNKLHQIRNARWVDNSMAGLRENVKYNDQPYHLGTLAYCMRQLNIKNAEIWLSIGDRVIDECYVNTVEELAKGLKGFQSLEEYKNQIDYDQVIFELEKNCYDAMDVCDLKGFTVLVRCLEGLQSNSDILYDKIEDLVMTDLEPGYKSEDLVRLVRSMAKSKHGSIEFYKDQQGMIIDRMPVYLADHAFVADFLSCYTHARTLHPDLQIEPEMTEYLNEVLHKDTNKYSLGSIARIQSFIDNYEIRDTDQIIKKLDALVFSGEIELDPVDMGLYLVMKLNKEYKGDVFQMPNRLPRYFDNHLLKHLKDQNPSRLCQYMRKCSDNNIMSTKKDLMNNMIEYLMETITEHDGDDLHFYYGFYNEYHELIEPRLAKHALNDLKDYIRFFAVRDRPFARL